MSYENIHSETIVEMNSETIVEMTARMLRTLDETCIMAMFGETRVETTHRRGHQPRTSSIRGLNASYVSYEYGDPVVANPDGTVSRHNTLFNLATSFFDRESGISFHDNKIPDKERTCFCCGSNIHFTHHVAEWYKKFRNIDFDDIYSMWDNENVQLLCCGCMKEYKDLGGEHYVLDKRVARLRVVEGWDEETPLPPQYNQMPIILWRKIKSEMKRMGWFNDNDV